MPGSCPIPALFCGKQLVFPGFRGDLSTGGGRQILSQFPSHEGAAACGSALAAKGAARTFAGREVFLARYTPRPKTDFIFFAPAGANSARLAIL